ncbi:MAG: D-alanyl-D-alanine carboxypeptidase [Micropruina sp.]
MKLVNKTRTTAPAPVPRSGSGAPPGHTITVTGRVALKRATVTRLVTVSSPARYAAHTFTNLLKQAGVSVGGKATTGKTPKTRVTLAKDTSEPLSVLVRRLLKPSNNGLAEHLVKTMGRVNGKAGTWKAGSAKLRTWLKTTQSVPSAVRIVDGSGLAHSNKLTARVIVRLRSRSASGPGSPPSTTPCRWPA